MHTGQKGRRDFCNYGRELLDPRQSPQDVVVVVMATSDEQPSHQSAREERAGLVPSHGITIDVLPSQEKTRPALIKHV